MMMRVLTRGAAAVGLIVLTTIATAYAQTPAEFYKGKNIEL